MTEKDSWLSSGTFHTLITTDAGALFLVVGGAGILEWADVFGNGGSTFQLVASIFGVLLGLAIWYFGGKMVRK